MSSEHMIVHLLPSVPLETNNTTPHVIETSDNYVYLQTVPDSSTQQSCSGTGSIDIEDDRMIQQICGKEATSSAFEDEILDFETTYIRDILLAEHPQLPQVENAVGSLTSTENVDLLNAEALSGFHQPDCVLLEALRILSEDPSLRKLQAALDIEANIVHSETSRYRGQCIQANSIVDSGMKIKGRKSKNKKSFTENASKKGTKKREKTPPASQKILKDWLFTNCYHPYPSDSDKCTLCLQTGLSLQQLNNWFINARRRVLPNYLKQKKEVDEN